MVDQESWDLRCWLQPVRHRARTATEPAVGAAFFFDTKNCVKIHRKLGGGFNHSLIFTPI